MLLRLLLCDLVGEAITRDGAATLRDDIADLLARLAETEQSAALFPRVARRSARE